MKVRYYYLCAPAWQDQISQEGVVGAEHLGRPWLRWMLFRETYRDAAETGSVPTRSWEFLSRHWTYEAARRARMDAYRADARGAE